MARIRSIKPEFWTSEQIVECSTSARLLFIGLWNFADDGGVHPASPRRLKMEVFPGDDFSLEEVSGWVSELLDAGLLVEYEAESALFWAVTGWKHQKIDRPSPRYPTPPEELLCSAKTRRPLGEDSSTAHPRKGREGKGRESKPPNPLKPESTKRDEPVPIPAPLNTPEFEKAWKDFLAHRVDIRAKATKTSQQRLLKKCLDAGIEQSIEAIGTSIESGWKGIFPEKGSNNGRNATNALNRPGRVHERDYSHLDDPGPTAPEIAEH